MSEHMQVDRFVKRFRHAVKMLRITIFDTRWKHAKVLNIMNVSLTSKFDAFVEEQVATGRYRSASEVVREGLRLLEVREARLAYLRSSLKAGQDSGFESGETAVHRIRKNLKQKHGV